MAVKQRNIASSPVNSSARLVGTVGGAVTFVLIHAVRHLEKEALSNPARSGRIEEEAWGRGLAEHKPDDFQMRANLFLLKPDSDRRTIERHSISNHNSVKDVMLE